MRRPLPAYRSLLTAIVLALGWAAPTPAHAWSNLGHRLVGRLAEDYLSSDARKLVRRLLRGQNLADAAGWADSIRRTRRNTYDWHFINLPLDAAAGAWRDYCPGSGCILRALEVQLSVLADTGRPDHERAEALRFVVHFIGDLHSPLHVSDRSDRGGNDLPVTWNGRDTNLHAVWDTRLLASARMGDDRWFGRLRQLLRKQDRKELARGTVEEWAQESHLMARDFAYAVPAPPELAGAYARDNLPRAELQLVRAGIRLAELLNRSVLR